MIRLKTLLTFVILFTVALAIKDIVSNDVTSLGKVFLFFVFYCIPILCIIGLTRRAIKAYR